jgi:GNAT superfamily N-acetyltransferase
MQFSLQPMQFADAQRVSVLIRTAFAAQSVATDPPASALRETADSVAATLALGGGAMAVAGAMLAGAVLWYPKEGGLYLGRLSVAPQWRGKGVARALVAAVEAAGRAQGLPRLHLSTRLALLDNRRLFATCGFHETTRHAHPGYAAPTFVNMEKSLAEAQAHEWSGARSSP